MFLRSPLPEIPLLPTLSTDGRPQEYVFLPSNDIALYVGRGVVDVGITGHDLVMEVRDAADMCCSRLRVRLPPIAMPCYP